VATLPTGTRKRNNELYKQEAAMATGRKIITGQIMNDLLDTEITERFSFVAAAAVFCDHKSEKGFYRACVVCAL
jgi:hypothetical protein